MLNQAYDISHDFADWCAKRIEVRPPYEQLVIDTSNIGDWIKASYEKHVQAEIECLTERLKGEVPAQYIKRRLESPFGSGDTRSLVTRTFKSSMSLRTVRRLSEDWHDAVADQRFSGDTRPFPKAWATATEIGEFKIVPLESALDLHHEGKAMHNCVTTYSGHVHGGACYLFSMQKDERRIATIEIGIGSDGFRLAQFSGPCNQRIDKKLERIIRKWVRATKFEREEVRNKLPAGMEWCPANGANLDLEIPF
jgi:hypothetical protein